jgi:phosphomannomutase
MDTRTSGPALKSAIFAGLLSTGCETIDIGICPTPTVQLMVKERKAQGGIVVTASHNPAQWNGIKFIREDGIFLNEKEAKELIHIYETKKFRLSPQADWESIQGDPSAIYAHIRHLLKLINVRKIRKAKLKVALDSCNGAGSKITLLLLKELGCKVHFINCDITKVFPRNPEPIPENLKELCHLVKREKCDIGFAQDADADRLAIVDENGHPIGEENTLALAADYILNHSKDRKKIVVTNLSTTRLIDDVAKKHHATIIRTKIGEVNVVEEMKDVHATIGGEGNGGVIWPAIGYSRDSLAGIALTLSNLAGTKLTLSELLNQVPKYFIVKTKVSCKNQHEAADLIEKVKAKYHNYPLDLTEGVKINFTDGWLHVRASNTEPIVRIIAEATSKHRAEELAAAL